MKVKTIEQMYHTEVSQYSIYELCETLGVTRSSFYNHIFRRADQSHREKKQAELLLMVQEIFNDSQQHFSAKKIRTILAQNGMNVSAKQISEIMQELDLRSIHSDAKRLDYTELLSTGISAQLCI